MDRGKMTLLNKFSLQIYTMYCENDFTDFFIETSKKMSLIESLAHTKYRELQLQVKKVTYPIYKNCLILKFYAYLY